MSAATTSAWLRSSDEGPILGIPLAGRIAAAAALVLGSGCQAVAFLLAQTPTDSTEWLTWIVNNPGCGQLSKLFDVLAMPFLIATAAVYITLGCKRSPRLAWIAGVALGAGLVGLAVLQGWEVFAYNFVTQGVLSPAEVANAVDNIASSPAGVAVMLLFFSARLWGAARNPVFTLAVAGCPAGRCTDLAHGICHRHRRTWNRRTFDHLRGSDLDRGHHLARRQVSPNR